VNNDAIKKVYGRAAGVYDVLFGPIADSGRKRVVSNVNQLPGGRVLEVGVGTGISLTHYDPKHTITGIDLSPEMLDRAKYRVAKHGVKDQNLSHIESLAIMDAEAMTYDDSLFDIVVAMYVMSVVPSPEKVIHEIQRVCKPGGKIFIVNHFSQPDGMMSKIERLLEPYSDSLGWSPHFPIEACLGTDSLEVKEQRRVPPLGFFTMLICDNKLKASNAGLNGASPLPRTSMELGSMEQEASASPNEAPLSDDSPAK